VVFLCLAVAWSLWAHFDIAVTANGQAIASSKTKMVQALDAGRVVSIHVKDGDVVKQGDALIELDATITDADAEKSQQDRTDAQLDLLRLQAQLQGRTQLQGVPDDVPEDALLRQQQFLQSRVAEQQNKMAVLEQEVIRRCAELESAEANIQKIGRKKLIRARIRGGKVQRRKVFSAVKGFTIRGGKLVRMKPQERLRRKMAARRAKVKRKAKMARSLIKRKRSLVKRKALGIR
jgi:multidrug efflux pump subunit AcrA (membrane-fusion protein)